MDAQPVPGLTDTPDTGPADTGTAPDAPPSISRGAVLLPASGAHDNRLADDLAFAAEIGLQHVRLDVPWAAAQPKSGVVDGDVFEQVLVAAAMARSLGLAPWFRLMQPAVPNWFDDEGGFTDERNAARWWPRWVEVCAERLGEVAAGWVPFEAPYAMAQRLIPDDPRRHGELMHLLVLAWRDAWRILRTGPPVALSIDVAVERPTNPSEGEAHEARRRDQLRWGLWLEGLADGVERIPGRADRPIADLAGACDIVGLACRTGVEAALHRAAEQGPERPLALTFRPMGETDAQRAQATSAMWREVREVTTEVAVTAVTITPFIDDPTHPDRPGIATPARRLKDTGEAFVSG